MFNFNKPFSVIILYFVFPSVESESPGSSPAFLTPLILFLVFFDIII